jgi:molecular chaperone HscB
MFYLYTSAMNYFELYGMQETLMPDPSFVKSKYYELSRHFHPDHYAQAEEEKKNETLKMAALNNEAYKTLSDPGRLLAYVLRQHHMLEDEEKYQLPQDFLMEMMDLNEELSEYEAQSGDKQKENELEELVTQHNVAMRQASDVLKQQYDTNKNEDTLLRLKDYYFRQKYLERIVQRLHT